MATIERITVGTGTLAFNPDHIVRWSHVPAGATNNDLVRIHFVNGGYMDLGPEEITAILPWLMERSTAWPPEKKTISHA